MTILSTGLATILHPIVAYESIITDKDKIRSYAEAMVLIFLVVISRITSIYMTHAPLAKIEPLNANLIIEVAKIFIPFITWVIACYGVTSIMDGETTFYEIVVSSAYSLIPYILITIPLALLSNIMSASMTGLYGTIQTGMWIWIILLFFSNLKITNDYTFKKAIGVFFLVLCGMALIWAITVLFYALTSNSWNFIKDVQIELKSLWLERKW